MTFNAQRGEDQVSRAEAGGDPIHPLIDLYRRYERQIYRQCFKQLRHPADAQDAVQETFARAALHLDQLAEAPEPYLATVARNVCRDELQRRARCISSSDPDRFGELEVGHPETTTIDRDQLNAAWKRFSPRERELIGRRFAGFSYEEIAGHLDMTTGALNVALARARKRARQYASMTVKGALAIFSLRRIVGRSSRSGAAPGLMPSALLAATTVTCMVIGGAGGSWLAGRPHAGAAVSTPTRLQGAVPGPSWPGGGTSVMGTTAVSSAGRTAAAGTVSTPRPTATVADVTSSVLSPGQNATQQDAFFTSLTPSPGYQQDHTVFGSGNLVNGCGRPTCPVIFRTQDGGATWQRVSASGFLGGSLLLPPAYPADPTIFAAGPAGLQRSDDGGGNFRTVVPGPAPAAIDPTSTAGAVRVLVAAQIPVIYAADTGALSAGPALPAGVTAPVSVAFGKDGEILLAADQPDPTAAEQQDGVLVRCPVGGSCTSVMAVAGQPVLNISVMAKAAGGDLVLAWSNDMLAVSRDAGASFQRVAVPSGLPIVTVALAPERSPSDRVVLAQQAAAAATSSGHLAQSTDEGASFTGLSPQGLQVEAVAAMVLLPDGREFAALKALAAGDGFGIRCSADSGAHWSDSC
jgi:RNA polymerase sigma-70 factor (ECF subfamily)